MITELNDNQIFVCGTNLGGKHYGGAAKQAFDDFGLEWGLGEGLSGKSYAFPTLDEEFRQRSIKELEDSRDKLYKCCLDNKDKEFLLTPVGMGIAHYNISDIATLFNDSPINLKLPDAFIEYLEK